MVVREAPYRVIGPMAVSAPVVFRGDDAAAIVPRSRVLLVEDEGAVASGIAALLEAEGMLVQIAENGDDAIAIARSWSPHIAIIDVCLPDMDGGAVYRRMGIDIPVIFSSGEAFDEQLGDLIARRNVSVLVKPYEIGDLYAAIRKLLP